METSQPLVAGSAVAAAVIVASDSVGAGSAVDTSGLLAVTILGEAGFGADAPVVVTDDIDAISRAVRGAVAAGARLVVVTGGTGIGPRDVTPEALHLLADKKLPGFGEAIRAASRADVPAADVSRALAVTVGAALVLGLPGSNGGVRDGLAVAVPLARHAIAMLDGGSHPSGPVVAPLSSGVRTGPFAADECARAVAHSSAGAVATFAGVVRDTDHGRSVTALTYEAHPDASAVIAALVVEAKTRPGVLGAAALHRSGDLSIGDLAFAAAVSAPHRAEAFAACAWLVDEVKARAPIWKHQVFSDGTDEWVNCP